jgi:Uma2 family endonuclease
VRLVLIVDPAARTFEAYEPDGASTFVEPSTFTLDAFPGLEIALAELFSEID